MTQRQQNFDEPPKLPHEVEAAYDQSNPDSLPVQIAKYLVYLNRWLWKSRSQLNGLTNPPSAGGHIIQDAGTNLTQRPYLNFTVQGTAADNPTTGATDVGASSGTGGGFLIGVEFTNATGNWTVPSGVSAVRVTAIAPGGGGASSNAAARGGGSGGAGESVEGLDIKVTPGGTVAYSVPGLTNADTDGGDLTFGYLVLKGGKKGVVGASSSTGGSGGGANGALGVPGNGTLGTAETNTFFGGSSGAGGGTTTATNGNIGGGSGGRNQGGLGGTAGGSQAGGGGSAATRYAAGVSGGNGGTNGTDAGATDYGIGGPGAGGHSVGKTGGKGGAGYLLITYVGTP